MKITCAYILLFSIGCTSANHQPGFRPVWVAQDSGTTASLRGLCVVNNQVVWAGGTEGTCLRTINGGNTWERLPVPGAESLDFRDVHAISAKTAWLLAAGEQSKIFHTRDGKNWTEQYACDKPGAFFDALAFWDAQRGVAFSDPVDGRLLVITTLNGGETWNEVDPAGMPPALPGEHGYAASGTCLVVQGKSNAWIGLGGPAARVFRSTDGGQTWSVTATPMTCGSQSSGIFSLAFSNARNGIAVGGDYQYPANSHRNVAITSDGGRTWRLTTGKRPNGYRSAIASSPKTELGVLIAVGSSGSDYSTDNGLTWNPIGRTGYHAVSFAAEGTAWAVGADGRIAVMRKERG